MIDQQVKDVVKHIELSWPMADIKGLTPVMWAKELLPLDFECAVLAVDSLRRSQDFPPGAAAFLEQYKAIHNHAHAPKQLAEPALQESPYLRAARGLIFGAGADLLQTPTADLSVEDAGLKAKILDAGQRHRLHLESGQTPDANMLVEVSNLGEAVTAWGEKHKLRREQERQVLAYRREESRERRFAAAATVSAPTKGRKSKR